MKKEIMIILLFIIMVIVGGYIFINKDNIFMSRVETLYPDGCIEVYEDTVLVTGVCDNGRRMIENKSYQIGRYENIPKLEWNLSQTTVD